jgi:hypothetical protein
MTRTLTPSELESVRLTEAAVDRRPPLVKAASTVLKPREGYVKLYDPLKSNRKFGGASRMSVVGESDELIIFGGVEPHVAIVREGHPLIGPLMKRHPQIVMLRHDEEPGKVYTCDICDAEVPSKRALGLHRKEVHAPPEEDPAPKKQAPTPAAQAPTAGDGA